MELRSRSRSKTPFQTESFIEGEAFASSNHVTVTRSTRQSVRTTSSVGSNPYSTTKPTRTKKTKANSVFKTSDYSSEEGDFDFSHISENEKNQIIEDAKAAANGTTKISALTLYRKAERYWDKYPKTDYTYSRHSRDRVEIAPGVVQMPNMSRRTIHTDSSTNTDAYSTPKSHSVKHRLFSYENNNEDELDSDYGIQRLSTQRVTFLSKIVSVFVGIFVMAYWCLHSVYQSTNSLTVYLGKKLHHLSSRVMLLDTWLLRNAAGGPRKTKAVIALCLLPLLFFGAWLLLSSLGSVIYWSYVNSSSVLLPPSVEKANLIVSETHILDPPATAKASLSSSSETHSNTFAQINKDEIIEEILRNPKIYNVINNYFNDIKEDKQSGEELLQIINQLKSEINNIKEDLAVLERNKDDSLNRMLSQIRTENIRNIARLTQKLNRCCGQQMIDLEPHLAKIFALLNDPEFLSNQHGLVDWLHTLFVAKNHLEHRLTNLTRGLDEKLEVSVAATANQVMEKVVAKFSAGRGDPDPISEEAIKKVVQSALRIYDADKTGLVDYAMEPLGGQIVTTRCTESYHSGTAVISVLGIPLWHPSVSPRVVISPGVNPGECWAFQNFPGFLVIKLAAQVKIEAFSVEHVSRLLIPDGKIDSAIKEFEVYGLNEENEKDPKLLGEYAYDYDGDAIQFFISKEDGLAFSMVEVRIKSNHGNPNYTCLYRFRVHGRVSNEPT